MLTPASGPPPSRRSLLSVARACVCTASRARVCTASTSHTQEGEGEKETEDKEEDEESHILSDFSACMYGYEDKAAFQ